MEWHNTRNCWYRLYGCGGILMLIKIKKHPQVVLTHTLDYSLNKENIMRISVKPKEGNTDLVEKDFYFDLNKIEENSNYIPSSSVISLSLNNNVLEIESINALGEDWSEEESKAEWEEFEISDFEVPDSETINEFEKYPEIEIPADENKELINELQSQNRSLELKLNAMQQQLVEDRRTSEKTTLELLELMTGLL